MDAPPSQSPRYALARWLSQTLSNLGVSKAVLSQKTGIARSTVFAFTTTGKSGLIPDAKALGEMLSALHVDARSQQAAWDAWKESWRASEAEARGGGNTERAAA